MEWLEGINDTNDMIYHCGVSFSEDAVILQEELMNLAFIQCTVCQVRVPAKATQSGLNFCCVCVSGDIFRALIHSFVDSA